MHEGGTNLDQHVAHSAEDILNRQSEDVLDVGKFSRDHYAADNSHQQVMLEKYLEMNLKNLPSEELNLFHLMDRCENDACLVAAVLCSFFTQGLSCCRELLRAFETDQRDQLLLQTVEFSAHEIE